jgi:hypothetical protein
MRRPPRHGVAPRSEILLNRREAFIGRRLAQETERPPGLPSGRTLAWYAGQPYQTTAQGMTQAKLRDRLSRHRRHILMV